MATKQPPQTVTRENRLQAIIPAGDLLDLETEKDKLTFALQRVVNLLENASPMHALEVARKAIGLE